jgi:aminoglycoside phosphotransferase family enzyme/predicted kinase
MLNLRPLPDPGCGDAAARLAAHAAMLVQLRRPGACAGHPDAAGLTETHLSSLLLAGGHVYKLKKPVALPFVDFSTLARRQAACEEELRLNRRTAPQWYLGVVPVQQADGGAVIAAPGQVLPGKVVDWAVRMRRFDNRQTFDRLADEGRLGEAEVDRLAEAVAAFQAAQPPLTVAPGHAEATCQAVRDNGVELAALAAPTELAAAVQALQRWSLTAERPALMARRAREGRVRDGHGDLHLGNVFWSDGAAVLFDALEFDDRLRQVDTIGELAFTFMDLLAHGLSSQGWRFINATLEASGDWGALPLLAWWAVHRAAVRAKVALLSVPAGADAATLAAGRAKARRYLDVAATLAAPPSPRLVLMMGLSGSGKTAVAGQLARQLGGVRLRSDVERKRLVGLAPTARVDPAAGLYTAEATRRTYARLLALAEVALQAGVPVVVDAASLHRAERDAVRALAQRLGVPFRLLCCEAPTAVLRQRLADRQAGRRDASDATAEVLAQQLQSTEWPAEDESADLLRLATDVDWPQLAASVQALPLG